MKVLRITAADVDGLLKDIEEAVSAPSERCSKEEAEERRDRACRFAYRVTREALDKEDKILAGALMHCSIDRLDSTGTNGMAAAIICEAFCSYMDAEQEEDREAFKTKFIAGLDKAVQSLGEIIEETHDTSTEQSSQVSSDQSPATP